MNGPSDRAAVDGRVPAMPAAAPAWLARAPSWAKLVDGVQWRPA